MSPEIPLSPDFNDSDRSNDSISGYPSLHWLRGEGWSQRPEQLAVEAPLAIEIAYERQGQGVRKFLTITMRTPGSDAELALGFIFSEGLVNSMEDVKGAEDSDQNSKGERISTHCVHLAKPPTEDLKRISRDMLTTSACGLCGRSTLEGLPLRRAWPKKSAPLVSCALIAGLPERLSQVQPVFARTGGTHGAALFDPSGRLLLVREDVGRHNAVDKLVGAALRGSVPFTGNLLVLSGRISFELMQKASLAQVAIVAAVGAPSSMAVNLAQAAGITLIGFVRGGRFNVYTHAERLESGTSERAERSVMVKA